MQEHAEHVIVGKTVFLDRVQEAGWECNLVGILGTEGEGGEIRITRKDLLKFLKDTVLVLVSRMLEHFKMT